MITVVTRSFDYERRTWAGVLDDFAEMIARAKKIRIYQNVVLTGDGTHGVTCVLIMPPPEVVDGVRILV